MTLFLLFLRECRDESLVEYITLLEERIFFCHFPLDALRFAFTIALGRESLFFYPMLDEIIHDVLSTLLRESFIILVRASAVCMG